MNAKELYTRLEAAGQAAGYRLHWWAFASGREGDGVYMHLYRPWRPHEEIDQAARLALDARISTEISENHVRAWSVVEPASMVLCERLAEESIDTTYMRAVILAAAACPAK